MIENHIFGIKLQEKITFSYIFLNFHPTELSEVKREVQMKEDKKTRRQGDETNVMISGRNVSISNVLYSRIPVFLYSKTQVLNSLFNFIL